MLRRGTNIRRWAIAHGFPAVSVYAALKGTRHGVQSHRIRAAVGAFLN
jgi:gp16 family phage-associated protein